MIETLLREKMSSFFLENSALIIQAFYNTLEYNKLEVSTFEISRSQEALKVKILTKYWRWPYFRITVHEKLRTLLTLRPSLRERPFSLPHFETENAQWINIYGKKRTVSPDFTPLCVKNPDLGCQQQYFQHSDCKLAFSMGPTDIQPFFNV